MITKRLTKKPNGKTSDASNIAFYLWYLSYCVALSHFGRYKDL